MYVSTAKVLRQFAQKFANTGDGFSGSEPEIADTIGGPVDLNAAPPAAAKKPGTLEQLVSGAAKKPGTLEQLVSGARDLSGRAVAAARNLGGQAVAGARDLGGKALDTGKALGGKALDTGKAVGGTVMENPGYAALGAGLGGAGLYGIARLLQSEEDRKKRRPIVAPALGAVGGAVALPALLAALSGNKTSKPDAPAKP